MSEFDQEKVVNAYQIASRGDYDHARMILEEALYETSENIEAWLLLADLAETPDEARQCYQMILEISPENWIAQQRLKILFGQQVAQEEAEEPAYTQAETYEEFPEFDSLSAEEELDEDYVSKPASSWRDLVRDNRKFFIRLGAAVGGLFLLMIIAWVATVGFMAWRLGYMIIG